LWRTLFSLRFYFGAIRSPLGEGGKETFLTVDGKPVKLKVGTPQRRKGGGRKPVYGPKVIASLWTIWAFFWFRCGKLLAPLIRDQMSFFQAWPDFAITPDVRKKLLRISPATIDRALKEDRKKRSPRVYRSLCPLLNYFLPTVKLIDKQRVGAKVRKIYDKPMIPYQRLMACPDLSGEAKAELRRRYQRYNPVLLQQEVHRAVDALMEMNHRKDLMRQQSLVTAAREYI
jgi:hypothetical protein